MKKINYLMTAIILTSMLILYVEDSSTSSSGSTIQSSRVQKQVFNSLKLNHIKLN